MIQSEADPVVMFEIGVPAEKTMRSSVKPAGHDKPVPPRSPAGTRRWSQTLWEVSDRHGNLNVSNGQFEGAKNGLPVVANSKASHTLS